GTVTMSCRAPATPRFSAFPYTTLFRSPVHHVAIAGLLEQVHRHRAVGEPRAHPAHGRHALVARDGRGDPLDQRALLVLGQVALLDRKSTRLNSSHVKISYAVFCLKKKR